MGQGVSLSANTAAQYSVRDIQNLIKYGTGATIVETQTSPFDGALFMGGLVSAPWLFSNIRDLKGGFKKLGDDFAEKTVKGTFGIADPKTAKLSMLADPKTYSAAFKGFRTNAILDALPKAEQLKAMSAETTKALSPLIEEVKTALAAGDHAAAEKALAKIGTMTHGKIPPIGGFAKFTGFLSRITGYSYLGGQFAKLAEKSPLVAKLLPIMKKGGAGPWAVLQGGMELFTQVIPSFTKLGFGSGLKQLFKSTVKTAASVAGWVGGEMVGTSIGAAVGTVLCPIPVVGTALGAIVGGAIGLAGGLAGSWLAGKVADKVVGKNELELDEERKTQQQAQTAAQNPEELQAAVVKAAQKLQTEGLTSDDAKVAFTSLQRMNIDPNQVVTQTAEAQPQAAASTETATTQTAGQAQVPFTGNLFQQQFPFQQQFGGNDFASQNIFAGDIPFTGGFDSNADIMGATLFPPRRQAANSNSQVAFTGNQQQASTAQTKGAKNPLSAFMVVRA